MQAEEGGQALLNCFIPWHRLLMERPEYYYSWAPGVPGTKMVSLTSQNLKHKYKEKLRFSLANHYQKSPTFSYYCATSCYACLLFVQPLLTVFNLCVQLNESDFKVLIVTDDSSMVLNQLHVDEQGTYRCSLQGQDGTVFYRIHFLLTGKSAALKYVTGGELLEYCSLKRS